MRKCITRKKARLRRASRHAREDPRARVPRLTVHRTPQHIYAQVFDAGGGKVLASGVDVQEACAKASRAPATSRRRLPSARRSPSARRLPASTKVAFDRSGFKYHGRIKALADAAREAASSSEP
jgi:large subunit ribosomal protein L18